MTTTSTEDAGAAGAWRTEFAALFALAWPLVVAQLAQNALFTTDVIMMGWLGPQFLAAGALSTAFFNPFFLAAVSIVGAVAPLVAQARGARDVKAVRRIVRQGFWVAFLLAVLLLPFIWQVRPVLLAMGQDPAIVVLVEQYTQIVVWMFFPGLLMMPLRSLLSAFGDTWAILLITLGGVAVNAGIAYTLMFGHFGFPALGLRGAAIATVTANLLMFLAMLAFAVRHRRYRRYHILHRLAAPDWMRFREILRVGIPIGLTVLAEVGLFSVASFLMGLLGTNEVAAHAVALQLASLAFMVPLGIGIAATVRVGFAYGRRDREGVRKAGWTSICAGTAFMAATCLLFVLMPERLVTIFLDPLDPANREAIALATVYLGIAGLFQLADGAQVVAAHALRGLSDTTMPMAIAIAGYWIVGLPTAYLLGFPGGMRGLGIWLGLAAGLGIVALVLCARFALRERFRLLGFPMATSAPDAAQS